jgi:hypothetical protein
MPRGDRMSYNIFEYIFEMLVICAIAKELKECGLVIGTTTQS